MFRLPFFLEAGHKKTVLRITEDGNKPVVPPQFDVFSRNTSSSGTVRKNVVYPVRGHGRTRHSLLADGSVPSLLVCCSWNVFRFARPPPRTVRRLSVGHPADLLLSSHCICHYCITGYFCAEFDLCQAFIHTYGFKIFYRLLYKSSALRTGGPMIFMEMRAVTGRKYLPGRRCRCRFRLRAPRLSRCSCPRRGRPCRLPGSCA